MQYIVILILILINGFFSCAEMAMVSINKNKLKILKDQKDKRALLLDKILEDPSRLLSIMQISVTVSGFLASAFTAVGISDGLEHYLIKIGFPSPKEFSIIISTIILSYFTLVLGELVPKRIGLRYSEKISLGTISFINILYKILSPFVFILSFSTNLLLKVLRFGSEDIKEDITKEEIKSLLEISGENVINDNEIDMIKKVIEFDEKSAREVMKPRTSIFAVEINEDINKLIQDSRFIKYSRIPVYEEELDNIVGILHVKEILINAYENGFENVNIRELIKDAYFVPESININNLFKTMKAEHKHFTILVDEYGGVSGIVTLEDLLEEVVGNISDEFDIDDDKRLIKLGNNKYLIDCEISLHDLNELLKTNLKSEHYDSLNGFLIEKLGFIPKENEQIHDLKYDNLVFKIHKIKNKKIEKVILEMQLGEI